MGRRTYEPWKFDFPIGTDVYGVLMCARRVMPKSVPFEQDNKKTKKLHFGTRVYAWTWFAPSCHGQCIPSRVIWAEHILCKKIVGEFSYSCAVDNSVTKSLLREGGTGFRNGDSFFFFFVIKKQSGTHFLVSHLVVVGLRDIKIYI